MTRLVVVSNRVPSPRQTGASTGGLAVAMREALRRSGGLWFGWSGDLTERPSELPRLVDSGRITYATIDLTPEDHDQYYNGYANGSLWPLFHYRLGLIEFSRQNFEGYLRVNELFARRLRLLLRPDDIIWVHDYHLIPLGSALRRDATANRLGFFLHTPFPASQVLAALPNSEILVRGLCAYDLVGFQTRGDLQALQNYLVDEAGGRLLADGGIEAFGARFRADVFPIGIDTERFAAMAAAAATSPETVRLKESLVGRALIIGVDRLDYSKGLIRRFQAFEQLLAGHTEHRARVTYLQVAPSTRSQLAQYRSQRRELEAAAGRINGKYAEFDWAPIRYLNRGVHRRILAGFLRVARIGLVTPFRDGMNLVAKEYVAAQDPSDPGVLVLSRFAGAAVELSAALIVNPFDVEQVAEALHRAVTMPLSERQSRWQSMMAVLRHQTAERWRDSFVEALGPARVTA